MIRDRSPAGDEGSVLVMALAFLSLFGLLIAALLTFADSAFRTAGALHGTVETQYAADAALEGAINAVRGDLSIGKQGPATACFTLPALVNNKAATVRCTGRPGSGVSTGGAGGGAVPVNAVLTLPASAAEGVILSNAAAPFVSGNVVTNRTLAAPAGSALTVQGALTCLSSSGTGTVTAATTNCPAVSAPAEADPGYATSLTSAPAAATVPLCPAGAIATFVPGTYRSVAALNALTNGACANKRFHFTPGVYYFQFTDVGSHEWRVNDPTAEVVGGTVTAAAFPSRCDLAAAGVQFAFGADSRVSVTAGSFELCPPLSVGQRIAVYGVAATTPTTTGTSTFGGSTSTNAGTTAFTSPAAGAVPDGADATVVLCNKCTGALALGGFPVNAIPANALITSAVMNVTHARSATRGVASARITAADGTLLDYPLTPCVRPCAAGTTVESIDVSGLITTPARANGLGVRYTATDSPGLNAFNVFVDGVTLSIGYTVPGVVASSGCLTLAPYSPAAAATCAVLKGSGGAPTRMAIKGTVYAPLAPVDLSMTGQLNQVTQRGIIARTLQLGLTRGAAYSGVLLAMPGSTDRQVLMAASVGGVERLRAEVTFVDGLGQTPGASVQVTGWSVRR